jgi:hypothetical protein
MTLYFGCTIFPQNVYRTIIKQKQAPASPNRTPLMLVLHIAAENEAIDTRQLVSPPQ